MIKELMDYLVQEDAEIGNAIKEEYNRQNRNI